MKLYTRGQTIFFVIAGCILACLLTTGIISLSLKISNKANSKKNVPADTEISRDVSKFDNLPLAPLEGDIRQIIPVSTTGYTQDEVQNINVYELCSEAVVNINTEVVAYDWFLDPVVQEGGSGSGSIIDSRGYILTNVHVIQNANKIYVSLSDGTQYEAEVIGTDADSDLAVIKFNPPEGVQLKTIQFGSSNGLRVGQKVIAIGNPYGLARTMTTGIVSSLGRPLKDAATGRIINNMIQTDAAINPGNSGGPLLDTTGKMIGINTMIVSNSNSSAGVGFAVPAETAVRVVSDLLRYGKVIRGTMDITVVQLTNRIAQYSRLDISSGMLISEVGKGSLAEKAGLKGGVEPVYYGNRRTTIYLGGDVITQIDSTKISSLADYYLALETKRPGDTVQVKIRRNRQDLVFTVTLDGDTTF